MTNPPPSRDRYEREFRTMDQRSFAISVGLGIIALVAGVAMLLFADPIVVRVIGGVLLVAGVGWAYSTVRRRDREAIVAHGDWLGFRSGPGDRVDHWTDLTRITHVNSARHMKLRQRFVVIGVWNARTERFRRGRNWSLLTPEMRKDTWRLKDQGELPLFIHLGSMSPEDQDALRAHLARFGVNVPNPQDDTLWS